MKPSAQNPRIAAADPSVLIAAPFCAHPGHFWNYAEQVGLALLEEGSEKVGVVLHQPPARTAAPELVPLIEMAPVGVQRCFQAIIPWLGKRPALIGMVRPLETLGTLLLISGRRRANPALVLHLIDGTFLLLWLWVLLTGRRCVCNLMGGPETVLPLPFSPNPLAWAKRRFTAWLLRECVRRNRLEFCAETPFVRDEWRALVGEHVHCVPYAVFPLVAPVPREQARAAIGLPPGETIFLFYGTQREDKDLATVIRAAAQLSPAPLLACVGKHISGPRPAEILAELGYRNSRLVDRFVDEEESSLWFAACDAVLLPYAEGYEKGSGVIVEACRHLRPVIATDTGHLRDFVRENRNGWLFRAGDPGDLARCMREMEGLEAPAAAALRERVETASRRYRWSEIIKLYLDLYAKLRQDARGRRP